MESKEGYTYIPAEREEEITTGLLYFVTPQEQLKARKRISSLIKSLKVNPTDKQNVEYIEVDALLHCYLDIYKQQKYLQQVKYEKLAYRLEQERISADVTVERLINLTREYKPKKNLPQFTGFSKQIGIARTVLYSYLTGTNTREIFAKDFMAAVSKFGLDSPIPNVTRRLAFYGNT